MILKGLILIIPSTNAHPSFLISSFIQNNLLYFMQLVVLLFLEENHSTMKTMISLLLSRYLMLLSFDALIINDETPTTTTRYLVVAMMIIHVKLNSNHCQYRNDHWIFLMKWRSMPDIVRALSLLLLLDDPFNPTGWDSLVCMVIMNT